MTDARRLLKVYAVCLSESAAGPELNHVFQMSGLGKAPFVYTGNSTPKGRELDFPACDLCGHQIKDCYWFKSSDGKQFKVGSECVKKSNDHKLVDSIKQDKSRLSTERRRKSDQEKLEVAAPLMTKFLDSQKNVPHPNPYYAEQGKTNADYLQYVWDASGTSGKLKMFNKYAKGKSDND